MEKNIIENFSTYKPVEGEILGQFADFDITSKDSNASAANDYLTLGTYTVPTAGYPSVINGLAGNFADLPDYSTRGPILFGIKVVLSSNVPLVKAETLFSPRSIAVVATRAESLSFEAFRKFWSMRWNQLDPETYKPYFEGTAKPAYQVTLAFGEGNPFAFDVGGRSDDPDGDGFNNAQEFVFGSNPWVSNKSSGSATAPVSLGLIELNGVTDTSSQTTLAPSKYLSATFNVSMQHAFRGLSDTVPFSSASLAGLIGQAPTEAYVSNFYLTYIVEGASKADFSDAVEVFRINPKTTVNTIEGELVSRLLPHHFDPNVVGVTANGSTLRITLVDKDSVDGFTTRFMRVRVVDTSP